MSCTSPYPSRDSVISALTSLSLAKLCPGVAGRDLPKGLYKAALRHFVTYRRALQEAGLPAEKILERRRIKSLTDQKLLRRIAAIPIEERNTTAVLRHPRHRKFYSMACRKLGGWRAALRLIGDDPNAVQLTASICPDQVIEYIMERKAAGLSLTATEVRNDPVGSKYYTAARLFWRDTWISQYYGWPGAVEEAGFDPVREGLRVSVLMRKVS